MNNSQVAHVWAQQTKNSGKGSHFFFDGPTIYSYGYHFPIARFVSTLPKVVLLTTNTRSISTAGHIAKVRQAISHVTTIFYVPNVEAISKSDHLANFNHLRDRIKAQLDALAKCRTASTKARTIVAIVNRVENANAYSKYFRLGRRITLPPGQSVEELTELGLKWDKQDLAATAKRRKAQEKRTTEALARWLLGADNSWMVRDLPDIYMRVKSSRIGLPIIETSRGAEFPVDDAKRAYPALKRAMNEAAVGGLSGLLFANKNICIRLGEFKVDHVEADGTIVAGCHRIRWEEVQRVARLLGLEESNTNKAG